MQDVRNEEVRPRYPTGKVEVRVTSKQEADKPIFLVFATELPVETADAIMYKWAREGREPLLPVAAFQKMVEELKATISNSSDKDELCRSAGELIHQRMSIIMRKMLERRDQEMTSADEKTHRG